MSTRDEKRLEQIMSKAREPKYAPTGHITPRFTWEDHLEIEAIQERQKSELFELYKSTIRQAIEHLDLNENIEARSILEYALAKPR